MQLADQLDPSVTGPMPTRRLRRRAGPRACPDAGCCTARLGGRGRSRWARGRRVRGRPAGDGHPRGPPSPGAGAAGAPLLGARGGPRRRPRARGLPGLQAPRVLRAGLAALRRVRAALLARYGRLRRLGASGRRPRRGGAVRREREAAVPPPRARAGHPGRRTGEEAWPLLLRRVQWGLPATRGEPLVRRRRRPWGLARGGEEPCGPVGDPHRGGAGDGAGPRRGQPPLAAGGRRRPRGAGPPSSQWPVEPPGGSAERLRAPPPVEPTRAASLFF